MTEATRRSGPARRWLRWLPVLVVVAAAVVIAVWPRGSGATPQATGATQANLAPDRAKAALPPCTPTGTPPAGSRLDVTVTCLGTGTSVDLAGLVAGGPALVNVWASWCQPCQQELPALASYAAQPGAIRVVGMQVQSDQKSGLDLLASLNVHLPMVFDGTDGPAARALRLPDALPASYLVRPDGTAVRITDPLVFDSADQVRLAVTRYLGGGEH